jgi:hypothetical protein
MIVPSPDCRVRDLPLRNLYFTPDLQVRFVSTLHLYLRSHSTIRLLPRLISILIRNIGALFAPFPQRLLTNTRLRERHGRSRTQAFWPQSSCPLRTMGSGMQHKRHI